MRSFSRAHRVESTWTRHSNIELNKASSSKCRSRRQCGHCDRADLEARPYYIGIMSQRDAVIQAVSSFTIRRLKYEARSTIRCPLRVICQKSREMRPTYRRVPAELSTFYCQRKRRIPSNLFSPRIIQRLLRTIDRYGEFEVPPERS